MSWFKSTLVNEIPELIEKFENDQKEKKNEFYGVGKYKDTAGIMDPIYKILYTLINEKINFSQIYLGYKLSKNITGNYFTIEEKTISTAYKSGAKKTNYMRLLKNFFNKSYDENDKYNISIYKVWKDYIKQNHSLTKPTASPNCNNPSSSEKTYCANKKINDYGMYVINKLKSDFEEKYKDIFSSTSGGKKKSKTKKNQKGGTNLSDCINKQDPISFEKLENIVKFKTIEATKENSKIYNCYNKDTLKRHIINQNKNLKKKLEDILDPLTNKPLGKDFIKTNYPELIENESKIQDDEKYDPYNDDNDLTDDQRDALMHHEYIFEYARNPNDYVYKYPNAIKSVTIRSTPQEIFDWHTELKQLRSREQSNTRGGKRKTKHAKGKKKRKTLKKNNKNKK